ncbi:hypothetical protein AAFF_G00043240 [Aldrovandia affinis]|uniref:Uncharacterized protein n=1 Tax=Aldrovandia affinis TaxID=143900 RepID=A0AAD7WG43_9TELE|nr:hypothetical protein AAFF_G00043240 [Aldrovandia affinis]
MVECFLEQQPVVTAALLSPELLFTHSFCKPLRRALVILHLLGISKKPFTKTCRKGMQLSWRRAQSPEEPFLSEETYTRVVAEAAATVEQHLQEGVVRLEQEELRED